MSERANEFPDGRAMLADFIHKRTTQAKFAREVRCSESHLSLILKGERGISLGLAKRISEATGGEIPVDKLPHEAAQESAA
jgi:transcriptional regulator with XRE-family HTH domain